MTDPDNARRDEKTKRARVSIKLQTLNLWLRPLGVVVVIESPGPDEKDGWTMIHLVPGRYPL